jgi:hypothetical protein
MVQIKVREEKEDKVVIDSVDLAEKLRLLYKGSKSIDVLDFLDELEGVGFEIVKEKCSDGCLGVENEYAMLEVIEKLVKCQVIGDITSEIWDVDEGSILVITEELERGGREITVYVNLDLGYEVSVCLNEPVDDDLDYGGGTFGISSATFQKEDDVVAYIVNEIGEGVS